MLTQKKWVWNIVYSNPTFLEKQDSYVRERGALARCALGRAGLELRLWGLGGGVGAAYAPAFWVGVVEARADVVGEA